MQTNVSVAISHYVKQGKEEAFERALRKVIEQARQFKGYEGIQIIEPSNKTINEYLLLVRFDHPDHYEEWENSEVRKKWSEELAQFIHQESRIRNMDGLEFWFSLPKLPRPVPPTKWKMAFLTWLVIYPLILGLSTLAGMYLDFLHPFLRMLIVSMLLVGSMTYFLMPNITKVFSSWIFKRQA